MRVRELTWDDVEQVRSLWLQAFGALKPEDDVGSLARVVDRNPGLFLVAEAEGRVIGTAIGAFDGRRGHVYHVAVAPAWRRRGVGTALVRAVESRLFALGVKTIHLRTEATNTAARAFYERLGWTADTHILGMRRNPAQSWFFLPTRRKNQL